MKKEILKNIGGGGTQSLTNQSKSYKKDNKCYNGDMKHHNYKRFAFTLSEVLITLGIIGIVAAIVTPVLIQNYEKQETAAKVKAAYSILSQAINDSISENGDIDSWDFSLLYKDFANKYLVPYLKISEICDSVACIRSKMEDGRYFRGYYELNGEKNAGIMYSFILNNGMIVMMNQTTLNLVVITVDINGNSGKNTLGRDIFAFYLLNHSSPTALNWTKKYSAGLYLGGVGESGTLHAGKTRDELLSASSHRACNKETTSGGHGGVGTACAAVIAKDGWRITKGYPW